MPVPTLCLHMFVYSKHPDDDDYDCCCYCLFQYSIWLRIDIDGFMLILQSRFFWIGRCARHQRNGNLLELEKDCFYFGFGVLSGTNDRPGMNHVILFSNTGEEWKICRWRKTACWYLFANYWEQKINKYKYSDIDCQSIGSESTNCECWGTSATTIDDTNRRQPLNCTEKGHAPQLKYQFHMSRFNVIPIQIRTN